VLPFTHLVNLQRRAGGLDGVPRTAGPQRHIGATEFSVRNDSERIAKRGANPVNLIRAGDDFGDVARREIGERAPGPEIGGSLRRAVSLDEGTALLVGRKTFDQAAGER
jgi:hypothetical protein